MKRREQRNIMKQRKKGGLFLHQVMFLAILVGVLTLSLPAIAADFYVDPVNGSMENDGSEDSPWSTIQEVIDDGLIETQNWENLPYEEGAELITVNAGAPVKSGDTIYLRSGFHGHLFIQSAYNESPITIAADEGHTPELGSVHIRSGAFWVLRGLKVSPSLAPEYEKMTLVNIESHGWRGPASDISVEDCYLFSVEDSSGWSMQDWNDLPCNGVGGNGERLTIKNNYIKNVNFGISISRAYGIVEGNTVENFAGDGLRGLGDYGLFEYNVVKNCYNVNDNHDDGFQSWSVGPDGVGSGEVTGVVLRGNVILNYEDPDQPFRGPLQGIGMFDGFFVDWVIENNLVVVDHWHGISLYGARNSRIVNNTVLDPNEESPGPPWVQFFPHKDDTPVQDCVIRNNLATSFAGSDREGVTADHNLVIDDPNAFFEDPAGGDFRLSATSPAVDTGSPEDAPSIDIVGTPRPQGDGYDIGAYEYYEGTIEYPDAGVAVDASGHDSATDEYDSGIGEPDAETGDGSSSDSGCSCRAAKGNPKPLGSFFLHLMFLLFLVHVFVRSFSRNVQNSR